MTHQSPSSKQRYVVSLGSLLDELGILDGLSRMSGGRFIMAYHRILSPSEAESEWCHPAIWATPETLDLHLGFFGKVGRVVALEELLAGPDAGPPRFAITFDDAWADNLRNAQPVLARHGVSACFFVPTDAVTTGRLFWTEELAQKLGAILTGERSAELLRFMELDPGLAGRGSGTLLPLLMRYIEGLKEYSAQEREQKIAAICSRFGISREPIQGRIMDWDQIRQLIALGHTVGSHSRSHAILRGLDRGQVDAELVESRHILQQETGLPVEYFCFPNARYDALSASRVLAAGYRHGFRMHNLRVTAAADPALIPRFSVSEQNARHPLLKMRLLRSRFQGVR